MHQILAFTIDEVNTEKFKRVSKRLYFKIILLFSIALYLGCSGCAAPKEVRHLSSDVCLVIPKQTTKQEVLSFLGTPDRREMENDQTEKWVYYHLNKSFFGKDDYDVVVVRFRKDIASACFYREMSPEEFKASGMTGEEEFGD